MRRTGRQGRSARRRPRTSGGGGLRDRLRARATFTSPPPSGFLPSGGGLPVVTTSPSPTRPILKTAFSLIADTDVGMSGGIVKVSPTSAVESMTVPSVGPLCTDEYFGSRNSFGRLSCNSARPWCRRVVFFTERALAQLHRPGEKGRPFVRRPQCRPTQLSYRTSTTAI